MTSLRGDEYNTVMITFARHIAVSAAVLFLSVGAVAQSAGISGRFLSSIQGKCVSFPYRLKVMSPRRSDVSVSGTVKFQGNCYILTFGESKMYCDGKTEWLLDEGSKELQITEALDEDVDNINEGSIMNPVSIVGHLDRYFKVKSESVVTEGGKALVRVNFVPIYLNSRALAISSLSVWFKDGGPGPVIVKSLFQCADGTRYEFSIPSMTRSATIPLQTFKFDEKTLGREWEVTDLR